MNQRNDNFIDKTFTVFTDFNFNSPPFVIISLLSIPNPFVLEPIKILDLSKSVEFIVPAMLVRSYCTVPSIAILYGVGSDTPIPTLPLTLILSLNVLTPAID